MNNIFIENLKKFRIEKGLTQEQVAIKLNVNTQTVSRWECGTTLPDVLTLPELARFYEVTVDDFYKKVQLLTIIMHNDFLQFMRIPVIQKILYAAELNILN